MFQNSDEFWVLVRYSPANMFQNAMQWFYSLFKMQCNVFIHYSKCNAMFLFILFIYLIIDINTESFVKMNLLMLSALIQDKASSVQFLQQRGILHNPRICVNRHAMKLQLRDEGDRWRCHSRDCRTEVALRKDTWQEGSKLAYRDIILFIYCWSKLAYRDIILFIYCWSKLAYRDIILFIYCWSKLAYRDIILFVYCWSKLDYRDIILFIYCWSKEYTKIKFLDEELGIGKGATIDLTTTFARCVQQIC